MKKAILIALLGLCANPFIMSAGGANNVLHVNDDGTTKLITGASAGRCRHHINAHPEDVVVTTLGEVHDVDACN